MPRNLWGRFATAWFVRVPEMRSTAYVSLNVSHGTAGELPPTDAGHFLVTTGTPGMSATFFRGCLSIHVMTQRIGILGGTFDPVHLGHLVMADQCREQAALDAVWFVPARQPPHKGGKSISSPRHRLEMLRIAVSGTPQFSICEIEFGRDGPSYTIETLEQLQAQHPECEFQLIVGADMLADFPNWKEPARIASLCGLIAVNRGRDLSAVQCAADRLAHDLGAKIQFVEMPAIDVSASDIRERVSQGRSIRFLTPRGVEMYIAAQGLYLPTPTDVKVP